MLLEVCLDYHPTDKLDYWQEGAIIKPFKILPAGQHEELQVGNEGLKQQLKKLSEN